MYLNKWLKGGREKFACQAFFGGKQCLDFTKKGKASKAKKGQILNFGGKMGVSVSSFSKPHPTAGVISRDNMLG